MRFAVATTAAFLLFYAWTALVWLVYGLGTCGEDSDLTEDEFVRLCGDTGASFDGEIVRNLAIIVGVATIVGLVVAGAAIRRRSWRAVLVLAGLLVVAGGTVTRLA